MSDAIKGKNIVFTDSLYELPKEYSTAEWGKASKFNSKDRLTTTKDGREFQIIDKKTREFSFGMKVLRALGGILALVCSFGLASKCRNVRNLFKDTTSVRIAVPTDPFRNIDSDLFQDKDADLKAEERRKRKAAVEEDCDMTHINNWLGENGLQDQGPFASMDVEEVIKDNHEKVFSLSKKDLNKIIDAAQDNPEFVWNLKNHTVLEKDIVEAFKNDLEKGKTFLDELNNINLSKEAVATFKKLYLKAESEAHNKKWVNIQSDDEIGSYYEPRNNLNDSFVVLPAAEPKPSTVNKVNIEGLKNTDLSNSWIEIANVGDVD